jgi:hypothetical protein
MSNMPSPGLWRDAKPYPFPTGPLSEQVWTVAVVAIAALLALGAAWLAVWPPEQVRLDFIGP